MFVMPCPDLPTLRQFLLAELPESQAEGLEQHLLACDSCCARARSFQDFDTLLKALRSESTGAEDREGELVADLIERFRLIWPRVEVPAEDLLSRCDPTMDANPLSELSFLKPPTDTGELARLGSYTLRKKLGSRGIGINFEAEDKKFRREVTLMVMKPNLACLPNARKRFRHEAQAAAGIKHEHIVTIYQVDEDEGVPYLAMQLLRGESLQTRLERLGQLPIDEVLRIGREIAEGLAAAHERGLIHRDIQPSNIWLESTQACDRGGEVKILDFGLVWTTENDGHLAESNTVLSMPGFMAPEQALGARFDTRCDLFSLGCVLYQMCTGKVPFQGPDILATLVSLTLDQPAEPAAVTSAVPAALSDLTMQLLGKDPDQRPASVREIAVSLANLSKKVLDQRDCE